MTAHIFKFRLGETVVFAMGGEVIDRRALNDTVPEATYLIRWSPGGGTIREDWLNEDDLQDFASTEVAGS